MRQGTSPSRCPSTRSNGATHGVRAEGIPVNGRGRGCNDAVAPVGARHHAVIVPLGGTRGERMSATGTSASSRAAGTNPHPQHDLLRRVRDARQAAVSWLSNRVGDDGEPVGWADGNAWWRAPWALCLGGAPDVAAALIGWTERNALTDAGDYRPWPYAPRGESSPVYHLSPIAIAAWLLARYDTAAAINGTWDHFQAQRTGGAYDNRDFAGDDLQENLKTAQLGVSALVTGRQDIAQGVRNWLEHNLADQPELPTRFYPARRNGGLVTEFAERDAFLRVVDWTAP